MNASRKTDLRRLLSDIEAEEHRPVKQARFFTPEQETRIEDCELTSVQEAHVHKLLDACTRYYRVVMDLSKMGAGKTRCAQALGLLLGLPLFVLRPNSVTAWEEERAVTGCTIVESIGFAKLTSTPCVAAPKHGWLTRRQVKVGKRTKTVFEPTDKFRALVDGDGVLLVCDESQSVKNPSDRTAAFEALARCIVRSKTTRARVLLCSGSPFDKEPMALRVCQATGLLGLDLSDAASAFASSRLVALCDRHAPKAFIRNRGRTITKRKDLNAEVYHAFTRVVVPLLSSTLPSPVLDVKMDAAVGFYTTRPEHQSALRDAMASIRSAMHDEEQSNLAAQALIGLALQQAHLAKAEMTTRVAARWLEADPRNQVVVFGSYHDSLNAIAAELARFEPQMLTGLVKDRAAVVARFQSGERRLLVSNTTVGGAGLNLQDKLGGRKRLVLILPTYHAIDQYQAMYRCYRIGAMSDVTVRLMFSREVAGEQTLLSSLAKKGGVLRDLLTVQVKEGQKFLEDNTHLREEDDGEMKEVARS